MAAGRVAGGGAELVVEYPDTFGAAAAESASGGMSAISSGRWRTSALLLFIVASGPLETIYATNAVSQPLYALLI